MRYSYKRDPAQVRGRCLKLRRDNSVLDSDLRIAFVNTKPMAIQEIDSDEERRTRLKEEEGDTGNG